VLEILSSGALAIGVGVARPQPAEARCRRAANCDKGRFPVCQNNTDCFRANNVDTGRYACVVAAQCGDPCTTGEQCVSGLCIRAKTCRNDTGKFCADPCPTL
jgi:hypothetical protein